MFKAALLSAWHVHAHEYGSGIGEIDGAELKRVWDTDAARGADMAQKLGVPFEGNLDKILADKEIDGVIVTTATSDHVSVITKAAAAGKHVFTEKVLAGTVAECREIKKALDAAGVRFCISFPHRTAKHNLYAKKIAESGELGKITYMRVRNAHGGASQNWLPERFYDKGEALGGAMMDLGAHPMYLIRWILGRPESVVSAFGEVAGKGVDDNCVSTFTYKDGTVAVSETGFVSPFSPSTLEIYGTNGGLTISGGAVKIFKDGTWQDVDLTHEPNLTSALRQWVSGNIVFDYEAAEALTEMTETAYKAAKSGVCVSFN